MALDADTIFEFRSTATANMVNGGGFNSTNAAPGTDYSTNNTAHLTISDLVIGADNTTVTSVLTPFDAADNGNILHITAGTNFTVGWYEVVSVTAAVATLDRACGTALATGGTAYLGGALNVGGSLEDNFVEELVPGNIVYFYNNNTTSSVVFTLSEGVAMAKDGTAALPIKFIGYKTTRGDNPTGNSRPTIASGVNSFSFGDYVESSNFIFTGSGNVTLTINDNGRAINCKSVNSSTTPDRVALQTDLNSFFFNCEGVSYQGPACNLPLASQVLCCYLHDSKVGLVLGTTGIRGVVFGNIIANNINAIDETAAQATILLIANNTLYGSEAKTGVGINFITTSMNTKILNNIFYGFTTGIAHADATNNVFSDYNNFYNCTTPRTNVMTGANDQALDPQFTSVGQVTGADGYFVAGGSKLVDESVNFTTSGVVAGDCVYIVSGTGTTAGIYLIDSISTTVNANDTLNITVPASPGTDATADKTYQITTGHNFMPTGDI